MFNNKDIVYFWLPMFLTVGLTLLQLLPVPTNNQFVLYETFWHASDGVNDIAVSCDGDKNNLSISHDNILDVLFVCIWNSRFYIALCVFLLICFLTIKSFYFNQSRKKWLKIYLTTCMDHIFPSQSGMERCTVFIKKRGLFVSLKYFCRVVFVCGVEHWNDSTFWLNIKRTPNPFKSYFTMFVRSKGSYTDGTSTYFNVCRSGQEDYGLVAYSAYHQVSMLVETKQISHFYCKDKESFYANTANFKEYMSTCKISKEQLKCIHHLSNHFYVVPITSKDELETIAVMVIDVDSPETKLFNEELQDKFNHMARVLATIIRDE